MDSYDAERRPVFASTISDFIAKSIETDRDFLEQFDPVRDKASFEKAWQERSQGAAGVTGESIRDTVGTAIHVNLSMVAIEDNEVTKRLAAWAGIFGVATFFVGVWGMNFEHMPELKWAFGYPMAIGAIVLVSGALYWRFKRVGWL